MPTELEDYLFDLRGYLLLEKAVEESLLVAIDSELESLSALKDGESRGRVVRCEVDKGSFGYAFDNIIEAGNSFEALIDHPSWIGHIEHYCGGQPRLLHACAYFRGKGQASKLHGGGHDSSLLSQYRYHGGQFCCGMINVILALNDVDAGDGGTMLVPGSHKSHLKHPQLNDLILTSTGGSMDTVFAVVEIQMKRGDALLFSDCLVHGSARRVSAGERQAVLIRYAPQWDRFECSTELATRLGAGSRRLLTRDTPFD